MPKSATFTWPSRVMRMLAGLMSRWMTPLVWAEASASGDRDRRVDRTIGTHASLAAEDLGEAAPVDVLHDDVVGAGGLAPVVDADDVRVVEVRGGLRLTPEPLDERRVLGELGEEHLERDRAIEQLVRAKKTSAMPPRPTRRCSS